MQHSHGERGLFGGETGLFCPPETTDIVIQQGSFLHTCPVVLEAKNLFYFSIGNLKKKKKDILSISGQRLVSVMHGKAHFVHVFMGVQLHSTDLE